MSIDAAYVETLVVDYYNANYNTKGKMSSALVNSEASATEFAKSVQSRLSESVDFQSGNKLMYVRYASRLKRMLVEAIKKIGIHMPVSAISYSGPWTNNLGVVHIDILFDEDCLWRESLCQNANVARGWKNYSIKNGKYGTDNILLQYETGWNAAGAVFGVWKNKQIIASRRSLAPTFVLYNTVNKYNEMYKDLLHAELLKPYNVK